MSEIFYWKDQQLIFENDGLWKDGVLLEKIDSGEESTSFHYQDFVLKLYHSRILKEYLKEWDASKLSKIHTERFLLPEDGIFRKEGSFGGYSKRWVEKNGEQILKIKKQNLLEELKLLVCDIDTLSENGVRISDLRKENYIYNGALYNVDPGEFFFCLSSNLEYLKQRNLETFQNSLTPLFFEDYLQTLFLSRNDFLKMYRRLKYEIKCQEDILTYFEKEQFYDLEEFIQNKIRSYHL